MVNPDPTNAANLSSGDVPLAQLGNVPPSDTSGIEDDIALLGFKVASNGSLSKYNLVDQTEDAFANQDGVDNATSSDEVYDEAGKFFSGQIATPTGGVVTTYTDSGTDYTVHSFLSGTTNFVISKAGTIDYLLVGGGGGGGAPRRFSRIHYPRSTGDVRVAYDVTVNTLPCPSNPFRTSSTTGIRLKRSP